MMTVLQVSDFHYNDGVAGLLVQSEEEMTTSI